MDDNRNDYTISFAIPRSENTEEAEFHQILCRVYSAMEEKGYADLDGRLCGYFLTGDPTYITGYQNARSVICKADRYDLLTYMIKKYMEAYVK